MMCFNWMLIKYSVKPTTPTSSGPKNDKDHPKPNQQTRFPQKKKKKKKKNPTFNPFFLP